MELVERGDGERRFLRRRRRREAWIDRKDGAAVFVKSCRLTDPGAIARATLRLGGARLVFKGALHEAQRTLECEARIGRGARLLALGERRAGGVVVGEALLFEALLEHETLVQRIASLRGRDERVAALERAAEVLLIFDRARLSHLDLNPANVMLHATDPAQDCAVDIEQVVELDRPRSDLLVHGFGHLYTRGIEEHVDRGEFHAAVLPALARALSVESVPEDVLWAYRWFVGRSLRRRTRLRLARVGLERIGWMRRDIARRAERATRAGKSPV